MYRIKLPRAYPDRVRRRAVEDQLPLLQYACNKIDERAALYDGATWQSKTIFYLCLR